jgi:hypothetical protein
MMGWDGQKTGAATATARARCASCCRATGVPAGRTAAMRAQRSECMRHAAPEAATTMQGRRWQQQA